MILVDTSIWVNFLKRSKSSEPLSQLLEENQVIMHPWILGELVLGNLGTKRGNILSDLKLLPTTPTYNMDEILSFVEKEKIYGVGLSVIDVQLLYSILVHNYKLWTHDKQLHQVALSYHHAYVL